MPLASLFALQFYGPGCGAAISIAQASSPSAVLKGLGRLGAVGAVAPTAYARISDGRRLAAVDVSVASSPSAVLKGSGRMGAIGKVNELSQDDVTGAVLESPIEGTLTLKQALRLLVAVAAGKTDITDLGGGAATVRFRDLADTKDRIVATMADSERAAVTRDPT